jgi:hypothetical protein
MGVTAIVLGFFVRLVVQIARRSNQQEHLGIGDA